MELTQYNRVLRVRMWELGHSFDEIDAMNLEDMGDVFAYWREKKMVDERMAEKRKNLANKKKS
jgi:hypothetical protein